MYSTLLTEIQNGISIITINRPDKLSAINKQVMADIDAAMDEVYSNNERRVKKTAKEFAKSLLEKGKFPMSMIHDNKETGRLLGDSQQASSLGKKLMDEILAPRYENIWLVGGAKLCQDFLRLGLVDEIRLSIVPVLLGDGLHLFDNLDVEERWSLRDIAAYKSGVVELWYRRPNR